MADLKVDKTFRKGGRNWITIKSGDITAILYEQDKEEVNRVKNKFGDTYAGEIDDKFVVYHSGYKKDPTTKKETFFTYPPGNEVANGNAKQAEDIKNDTALREQITETATPTTDPNQNNTPQGETPSTPNPNQPTSAPPTNDGLLIYPLSLGKTNQDRIKFTAVKYRPSGDLSTGNLSQQNRTTSSLTDKQKNKEIIGSVFLPIQATINDSNTVDWQGGSLNAIERELVNLSTGAMTAENYDQLSQTVTSTLGKAFDTLKASGPEVRVAFAEQAVGIQGLLARFGTVLNPNLELLFTGPQLRPFDFTFKMSAREEAEAKNIKEIIKFFKKNMAPKVDGIFLRAPNTFFIEYKFNGGDTTHPGINLIKECALTSCSVDYTPLGTYMTYEDGTMVSYTMTLSFQELEPVYDKDYTDHSIGF